MDFTVYDKSTGEILRSGSCPEALVEAQCADPETQGLLLDVRGDDATQRVELLPSPHVVDVE